MDEKLMIERLENLWETKFSEDSHKSTLLGIKIAFPMYMVAISLILFVFTNVNQNVLISLYFPIPIVILAIILHKKLNLRHEYLLYAAMTTTTLATTILVYTIDNEFWRSMISLAHIPTFIVPGIIILTRAKNFLFILIYTISVNVIMFILFADFKYEILMASHLIAVSIAVTTIFITRLRYTGTRDSYILNMQLNEKNDMLFSKNIEISEKSETLQTAFNRIEIQNTEIKSGIKYASTIQNAILPEISEIEKYLNVFVVFRPKDIVSGDFYWFARIEGLQGYEDKLFIAAVDCTGHGVPGAFMSMIGSRLLNEIVQEKKVTNTAEILNKLHEGIVKALKQEQTENSDGMDICMCRIEKTKNDQANVFFTGAKRPLFVKTQKSEKPAILKGDRISIGGARTSVRNIKFEEKQITLDKGDMLYLTSDGYADQNNQKREKMGNSVLSDLINKNSIYDIKEQNDKFNNFLDEYAQGAEQRDDITLIGVKI